MYNECKCTCHVSPGFKHITACCSKCEVCSARIRIGRMEDHAKECEVQSLYSKTKAVRMGPAEESCIGCYMLEYKDGKFQCVEGPRLPRALPVYPQPDELCPFPVHIQPNGAG